MSVSYAAVELAKKIFGSIENKHVLILGAGKMGELAIQNLHGSGATKVTVINRTFEKAKDLHLVLMVKPNQWKSCNAHLSKLIF